MDEASRVYKLLLQSPQVVKLEIVQELAGFINGDLLSMECFKYSRYKQTAKHVERLIGSITLASVRIVIISQRIFECNVGCVIAWLN